MDKGYSSSFLVSFKLSRLLQYSCGLAVLLRSFSTLAVAVLLR
jgi:hypothetical protein